MRVAHVGRESIWLEKDGRVCEARLFAPAAKDDPKPSPAPVTGPSSSPLAGKIERLSPTELRVDRSAVDRLLDTPSELAQMKVVPDGKGVRLGPIKAGSSLALLGLETGDRLEAIDGVDISDTERMLAAYARLKSGNVERLRLRVTRAGKPLELDYAVR
jgi:type II secretory pathway component PulC